MADSRREELQHIVAAGMGVSLLVMTQIGDKPKSVPLQVAAYCSAVALPVLATAYCAITMHSGEIRRKSFRVVVLLYVGMLADLAAFLALLSNVSPWAWGAGLAAALAAAAFWFSSGAAEAGASVEAKLTAESVREAPQAGR